MAQAIMDPDEVRRFAEELKRFNADLQQKTGSLQARFAALGDTWQDAEHSKFADEFTQTMKAMKKNSFFFYVTIRRFAFSGTLLPFLLEFLHNFSHPAIAEKRKGQHSSFRS